MEKISPPLRIAIVAVLLFAVAWFLVLRPKPPADEPATPPPGIGGLSNDVKRAQNATANANAAAAGAQNAAAGVDAADGGATATKSTAATATATKADGASATVTKDSSSSATGTSGGGAKDATRTSTTSATATGPKGTTVTATKETAAARTAKPAAPAKPARPKAPADPAAPLVAALSRGKAVILVFRSRSSDSQAVADAARAVPKQVKRVVVRVAPIGQVGRYATFTEKTQISQAPTVLIIGPRRSAKMIVGYTSTAEVAEAVRDLRRAAR